MSFQLVSEYSPTGDQPEAIAQLVQGVLAGDPNQVLLGVTGSGKTFTMANVIAQTNRPTLILSHNKTLAAQLYAEFRQFFPESLVEFFISYYDYYQPEAYIAVTDTFIEKDLAVNSEIEKLRLRATSALLSGRRDIIIVSSVSCIYGIGRPEDYANSILEIRLGERLNRSTFLYGLVQIYYSRSEIEFKHGNFRVKGDTIEVFPAYDDFGIRIIFWGDEVEKISKFDPINGKTIADMADYTIFPANLFVTSKEVLNKAIYQIQDELVAQIDYFEQSRRPLEAKRVKERTEFDLEMMRELGYCSGVENYSRYLTEREPGSCPYTLLDYFPDDFLLFIDESHVTIPQVGGMYGGDKSRKLELIEHGFRLPSALDNRPLRFDEFESVQNQTIYVSATPADYELLRSNGVVVEQIIRPTGLLDPPVEIRPLYNQVDDLVEEIHQELELKNRVLVTTLTKRMSEELARYLSEVGIATRYLHSGIEALERVNILNELREGKIDVLVGINLLREGLDLPEVGLVAILDADKEGFLRSARAFIQIAGRAARNVHGRVILYADKITRSMQKLLDETERRRIKQLEYNQIHGIIPQSTTKQVQEIIIGHKNKTEKIYNQSNDNSIQAADPIALYLTTPQQLNNLISESKKRMEQAAQELNFTEAARFRDEMKNYEKELKDRSKN